MYCTSCGKEVPADGGACSCGSVRASTTPFDASRLLVEIQGTLKHLLSDPATGLPLAYTKSTEPRMHVAQALGLLDATLLAIGIYSSFPVWARPSNLFVGVLLLAIATVVILFGAVAGARHVLNGRGSIDADAFTAAVSLFPTAAATVAAGLIGIANVEVIIAIGLFGMTWSVLALYSGLTKNSNISSPQAAYATPVVFAVTFWGTSVVFRMML